MQTPALFVVQRLRLYLRTELLTVHSPYRATPPCSATLIRRVSDDDPIPPGIAFWSSALTLRFFNLQAGYKRQKDNPSLARAGNAYASAPRVTTTCVLGWCDWVVVYRRQTDSDGGPCYRGPQDGGEQICAFWSLLAFSLSGPLRPPR